MQHNFVLVECLARRGTPFFVRTHVAAMLWVNGQLKDAAETASCVLGILPQQIESMSTFFLGVVAAAAPAQKERAQAADVLTDCQESPKLAADKGEYMDAVSHIGETLHAYQQGEKTLREYVSLFARDFLGLLPGAVGAADPPMRDPFAEVIDDEALRNIAALRECARCGDKSERLKRCDACKAIWYCSKRCQTAHWAEHNDDCKAEAARGRLPRCAHCGTRGGGMHLCTRCRSVMYCCAMCQRADLNRHKPQCKKTMQTNSAVVAAALCFCAVARFAVVSGTVPLQITDADTTVQITDSDGTAQMADVVDTGG